MDRPRGKNNEQSESVAIAIHIGNSSPHLKGEQKRGHEITYNIKVGDACFFYCLECNTRAISST